VRVPRDPTRRRPVWTGLVALLAGALVAIATAVAATKPAAGAAGSPAGTAVTYPDVVPGTPFDLVTDEGSHPAWRVEWWYVTGWLQDPARDWVGFQVTFFRVRPGLAEANPSRFAPRQVMFAHAAIADPSLGTLRHAQRSARQGFGLAAAGEGLLDVRIDDWTLTRHEDAYAAVVSGDDFAVDLTMHLAQPPLLHGPGGYSRKGPDEKSASYYYSLPQLAVKGTVTIDGHERLVEGSAWFDHEWSSHPMDAEARGWDWMGVNLANGAALMAFRMRAKDGSVRWAGATLRDANGEVVTYEPDQVRWEPLAQWRSPRTGASYPVRWRVSLGNRIYEIDPLLEDAELDSRASTGAIYWEGPITLRAVETADAETGPPNDVEAGGEATTAKPVLGRGYLELTGYAAPLDL
jgi:predicted secreted hydrolase